jgi:chemotaxis regulatin CheY-phosphate phosphatase CheZ
MGDLAQEIGKITTMLEDAIEEQDWTAVSKTYEMLDELYDRLERGDDLYTQDYD